MKKIIMVILIAVVGCGLPVRENKFDGSKSVVVSLVKDDYIPIESYIFIERFLFIRKLVNGIASAPKMIFTYNTQLADYKKPHGNNIEFNIDGKIFSVTTSDTRVSSREGYNIINIEVQLPDNILEAFVTAKKIMLRVFTEDVYGITQNVFELKKWAIHDIQKIIKFKSN